MYDLFEQYEEIVKKGEGKPIRISKDIPVDKVLSLSSGKMLQIESDYDTNDIDDNISLKREIKDVIETLKEREADVIKMHFGIGGVNALTITEIAERFSLTRERVRAIKEKALRRLRHRARSTKLRPFAIMSPNAKNLVDYSQKYSRELEKERTEHNKIKQNQNKRSNNE